MAIDTTQVGEFQYPGEEDLGAPPSAPPTRRSEWLRPNVLWAIAGGVVGYLIGHWLGNVIASGYQQTQEQRPERRRHRPRAVLGRGRMDGRHRRA